MSSSSARRAFVAAMALGLGTQGVASVVAATVAPTPAAQTLRWAPCGVSTKSAVVSGGVVVTGDAGTRVTGCASVSTIGASNVPVNLATVDAKTAPNTGAEYAATAATSKAVGAWTSPGQAQAVVPAAGSVDIYFSARIPAGTAAGDHLGGLVLTPPPSPVAAPTSANPQPTLFSYRAVVPIVVVVLGSGAFAPSPISAEIPLPISTKVPVSTRVLVGINNAGSLIGVPELQVRLQGPGGYDATAATVGCKFVGGTLGTTRRVPCYPLSIVLPDGSAVAPVIWPEALAAGTYRISVAVSGRDGSAPTISKSFDFTLAKAVGVPIAAPAPPAMTPPASNAIFIALGAGLIVLVGILTWLTLRRPQAQFRPDQEG